MRAFWSGAVLAPGVVCLCLSGGDVHAQSTGDATALPEVVVTADRRPEPAERTGSAISVITKDELQTTNPTSLLDALRGVPGLDVSDNGGPGSATSVRIRGANSGQTLVLVDGIRVNDPSGPSGDFDFSNLLPTAIDRIEVLRGPQSALYGSDAIGGVVNIITKQGGGTPHFEARTEAGSYGTISSSASASGSSGPWSYAFSGGSQTSAGFSRYGYRIGQIERIFGNHFENDGFSRYGGYGRIGYDAGEGVKLELGLTSVHTTSQYDASSFTPPSPSDATGPFRIFPDTPDSTSNQFNQIFARGTAENDPLTQTLTVYANQTDRRLRDVGYYYGDLLPQDTSSTRYEYHGNRFGTEYQGDLKLGTFGTLTFGGRFEEETATSFSTPLLPDPGLRIRDFDARQATRSIFALYQLPIGERIVLSLGGRHDEVNALSFDTWRATGAYLIPETGTKLHASGGTGAKAPTLYQLFAPIYGNTALSPEMSTGWDAGIDQTLFGGRATISATAFGNHFDNLIDFDTTTFRYFNIAHAATSGIELASTLTLVPNFVRLTGSYTYLHAKDLETGLTLQRRPENIGRFGIAVTPLKGWLVQPQVTLVSKRYSGSDETQRLPSYARLDIYSEYKIDETWKVFGRVENVTDTRYQEVLNYATTGRAFYAGLNVTW